MNDNNLKNIGIIMGGYSHEYEISLKSGMVVYKTLKEHYSCYRILIKEKNWSLIDENENLNNTQIAEYDKLDRIFVIMLLICLIWFLKGS